MTNLKSYLRLSPVGKSYLAAATTESWDGQKVQKSSGKDDKKG